MQNTSTLFKNVCPEENTGYLLWQLSMSWQRRLNKELENLDLTHTQFVILSFLACLNEKTEFVTQIDVSNHVRIDRMMTSKVLRTLQKKAWVSRKEHETDTRAKLVQITELGMERLQEAIKITYSSEKQFFSIIQKDLKFFNEKMIELLKANENFAICCPFQSLFLSQNIKEQLDKTE